jgi:hypothetical protein
MAMNTSKTKWMAFLTESTPDEELDVSKWFVEVDGERIENVDEFLYLGFRLDAMLDDQAHVKMINDRFLRAAHVVGGLLNDLKCVNLANMRHYFVSLVQSQLYGLMFVDANKIEFERGLGVFVKRCLGLPTSFPHVVAAALLNVKHVHVFQLEQRLKFLRRWEQHESYPVFEMLLTDRCFLFPRGVGLNSGLGETLANLGLLRTLDYSLHSQQIQEAMRAEKSLNHRERLLATEGRAFWTELSADGFCSNGLKQVLAKLHFESLRVFVLLLADMLCWTALKKPTRVCPTCSEKFTSAHFFSCPRFFINSSGWVTLVKLCQTESWVDVLDYVFEVLRKWVSDTTLCRANFRLHVLEYETLCEDALHGAFRWSI